MIKETKLEKANVYKDDKDGKYYISVTYTYEAEDGTHELTYPKVDFPLSQDNLPIRLSEISIFEDSKYYFITPNRLEFYESNDKLVEPKERLNCRFVVMDINGYTRGNHLTIGKIYKVIDGKFVDDDNIQYPLYNYLYSWEDLVKYLGKDGNYSNCQYSILKIVDCDFKSRNR